MNKFSFLFASILPLMLLCGCEKQEDVSSIEEHEYQYVGGDLIFTELYVGEVYADRAVEIANVGHHDIDLSEYTLNIYRDGGNTNVKPTEVIPLSGTISPKGTYIITYSHAKNELKNKANLISEDFLNDGTFPMTLNKNTYEICDSIGYPGSFYDVANHSDAVKKKEKLFSTETYSAYDWIRYPTSNLDNLGNLNCLENDVIYEGPKLQDKDFDLPYAVSTSEGGGGLVEVTLSYTIDGDTSKFNFGNSLSQYGIRGNNSLRYYGINTPELAHNGNPADPYGPEARDFTNNIVNTAKHFLVQSIAGYSLTETYGRVLGYLWVTFENNPKPKDYFLLNHYVLRNGYARVGHVTRGGYSDNMLYRGISYVEYLYDAQQYAIVNKLHIHEEGL